MVMSARDLFERRKRRNRYAINTGSKVSPRLSVFRSSKNIYAQVIDDIKGKTLVSASTIEASQRQKKQTGANIEAATKIGSLIAERALKKGVKSVKFDRGGYKYHGRIKALAEAARIAGLKF